MPQIDLETLLKHYTEGRISKKEFVYLHSLITQSKQAAQKKPSTAQKPPGRPPTLHAQATSPNELGVPQSGMLHFFKSRYKSVVAFMGSLWIFATLAVNYTNGLSLPFITDSGQQTAIVQPAPLSKPSKSRPLERKDVKIIAESLIEEPIWEAHSVNEFTTQWIMLSAQQKDKVKKTPWFEQFSDAFKKQIKFELARQSDGGDAVEIENRHRALVQLAISLDIVRKSPTSLADLDKSLSPTISPRPKSKEKNHSQKAKKSTAPKTRKTKSAANNVSLAKKTKSITKSAPPAKQGEINGRDIVEVIDQYIAAFEKGSSQQMLALFADDSMLQRPLTLKTVRSQYSDLFKHSEERWVEFRGLSWDKKGKESRGKGKLRTSLRVLPGGEYKTVTTDVMLSIRKVDNVTRITDFELNDNSIFSLAHSLEQNNSVKHLPAKNRPKYPTQGELQDVVTQYVDSYQSGDIRRIMELFASGTWTADPAGLEELRKDYVDLFESTSDRQVFISNVDWSFKDNKAMGTGDLVINLLSKQDHKITKKKGKVRLIVEKNLHKTRISHLFQIVN
ncbi:hypothetical protein [Kaarinaea lacus]